MMGSHFYDEHVMTGSPDKTYLEPISAHIERHLGPVDHVMHELVSDTVHIDVHVVLPTASHPCIRLVTSGMSGQPMATPPGSDVLPYAELMLSLPPDWHIGREAFEDEAWYWPVRLLKTLARLPHRHGTWLGWGHTVPNGNPAQPYAPGLPFDGSILVSPVTVPDGFHLLPVDAGKSIGFLAVVPLHPEEMALKVRSGTDKLLERLSNNGVSDVFDPQRPNAAKRRFGLF